MVWHGGAKFSPFISYRNMISHGYAGVCLKYLRISKIFHNLEYWNMITCYGGVWLGPASHWPGGGLGRLHVRRLGVLVLVVGAASQQAGASTTTAHYYYAHYYYAHNGGASAQRILRGTRRHRRRRSLSWNEEAPGWRRKKTGSESKSSSERVFQSFWAEEGPRNTIQGETSAPGWLLGDF